MPADLVIFGPLVVRSGPEPTVLSADPRAVPPEDIADLDVRATYLAGRRVYAKSD